ncbi:hypothetical protein AGLY_001858 [Aphis glycines]|uniref:Uncharacterized protein n=1 Tax=Aphis glycines TaxID=307491 RepID=A0A6G0U528_APHGL|nr:hypothetical protein AGLY_001858 [Aphis glycines]
MFFGYTHDDPDFVILLDPVFILYVVNKVGMLTLQDVINDLTRASLFSTKLVKFNSIGTILYDFATVNNITTRTSVMENYNRIVVIFELIPEKYYAKKNLIILFVELYCITARLSQLAAFIVDYIISYSSRGLPLAVYVLIKYSNGTAHPDMGRITDKNPKDCIEIHALRGVEWYGVTPQNVCQLLRLSKL